MMSRWSPGLAEMDIPARKRQVKDQGRTLSENQVIPSNTKSLATLNN